jgi:hypothetical protein
MQHQQSIKSANKNFKERSLELRKTHFQLGTDGKKNILNN